MPMGGYSGGGGGGGGGVGVIEIKSSNGLDQICGLKDVNVGFNDWVIPVNPLLN